MRHLCDSNVFIAITVEAHPAHALSRDWLRELDPKDTVAFCRMTEISFLRLLTQRIAERFVPLTNAKAVERLNQWKQLPGVASCPEPRQMEAEWLRLAAVGQAAPKRWMDTYLASFALRAGMRLVTLDADFRKFEAEGLDLLLLRAAKPA